MSDDIVTRLREIAIGAIYGINIAPFEHYNAAADEIERLRADRDRFAKHIEDLMVELRRVRAEVDRLDTALRAVFSVASEAVHGE